MLTEDKDKLVGTAGVVVDDSVVVFTGLVGDDCISCSGSFPDAANSSTAQQIYIFFNKMMTQVHQRYVSTV